MGYEELQVLAESYRPREQEALFELAQKYRSRDEREILELAAIAADISLDSVLNLGLEPERGPAVQAALFVSIRMSISSRSLAHRTNGLMDLRTESRESTSRCSCATA